jgi:hypothetical protein
MVFAKKSFSMLEFLKHPIGPKAEGKFMQWTFKSYVHCRYDDVFPQLLTFQQFGKFLMVFGGELKTFHGYKPGDQYHLQLGLGTYQTHWKGEVITYEKTERREMFIDVGIELPFFMSSWHHKHLSQQWSKEVTLIEDTLTFALVKKWRNLATPLLAQHFWARHQFFRYKLDQRWPRSIL